MKRLIALGLILCLPASAEASERLTRTTIDDGGGCYRIANAWSASGPGIPNWEVLVVHRVCEDGVRWTRRGKTIKSHPGFTRAFRQKYGIIRTT